MSGATIRKKVMVHKHGGMDSSGNPIGIDRPMWVDVKVPAAIPDNTPVFEDVTTDELVEAAQNRYFTLVTNLSKTKEAIAAAKIAYDRTLSDYAAGKVGMSAVEEAKILISKAESLFDATKSSLPAARQAVINARQAAIDRGMADFRKQTQALIEERRTLIAQLKHIDGWYTDLRNSFIRSNNILASFTPNKIHSAQTSNQGMNLAVQKYLLARLDIPNPDEKPKEKEKKEPLMRWRVAR